VQAARHAVLRRAKRSFSFRHAAFPYITQAGSCCNLIVISGSPKRAAMTTDDPAAGHVEGVYVHPVMLMQ
jgi:hypothetical protein